MQRKYIWKFALTKIDAANGRICIGIDATKEWDKYKNEWYAKYSRKDCAFYTLWCRYYTDNGSFVSCNTNQSNAREYEDPLAFVIYDSEDDDPEVFKENDEIRMELDVKNRTLQYYINEEKYGIWFKDIKFDKDTEYRMAVGFDEDMFSVSLTDFQVIE